MAQTTKIYLYQKVAEELHAKIRSGDFGSDGQLPTEEELAKTFNINRLTLRKSLGLIEDRGLIRRERGKGTFLQSNHYDTTTLGSVLFIGHYSQHLYDRLYLALTRECQRLGSPITAFEPEPGLSEEAIAAKLAPLLQAYSSVIVGLKFEELDRTQALLEGYKSVFINHLAETRPTCPGFHIMLDHNEAVRLAAEEAIAVGHRRIAYVGHGPLVTNSDEFSPLVRDATPYGGFCMALHRKGIEEHRALGSYLVDNDFEDLAVRFLERLDGWATCVVCSSDYRAMLLMHAATWLGIRIPEDLSIVSVGNTPWSEAVRPRLTTVSLGEEDAAALAVNLSSLPAPKEAVVYTVNPKLIAKESLKRL